jgi:hypothetical protein
MANGSQGWCTTTFTQAQLDGKKVFFTMPANNQYYTGHFHILAVNPAGQFQIEIDYARPVASGPPDVGMINIDQSWADQIAVNVDPSILADFIIHPLG